VRRIERFVEKPDEVRAKVFIENGYLWNSGNFVLRADAMLEELKQFEPQIATAAVVEAVERVQKDLGFVVLDRESFVKAPRTSIDYAVMERTHRAAVLATDVGWSDVGQWSTVWRLSRVSGDFSATVPEPSTWAMMGIGFALLGFVGFRSRKASVSMV
jgi:mannose-1-phosphate guanylyltransferase / mannose-6-phosphate isomerase